MVMVCGCGVWWVRVGVVVVGGWGGLELWSHLEYFTKILNRQKLFKQRGCLQFKE